MSDERSVVSIEDLYDDRLSPAFSDFRHTIKIFEREVDIFNTLPTLDSRDKVFISWNKLQ